MPRKSGYSKGIAAVFVILTVSAIAGMIGMLIIFEEETKDLNMTAVPTMPSTTLAPPPVMRLPKTLIPDSYNIVIQPHMYFTIIEEVNVTTPNQTLVFTGNSTVNFHCLEATKHIFLHSRGLNVSDLHLINKNTSKSVKVKSVYHHNDESNFLEIETEPNLVSGLNYSLFMNFEGQMSETLFGLYVSTYVETIEEYGNETTEERFLAATNLQPTEARALFPCFDEPEMKAVFDLTVIHRRGTSALGNMLQADSSVLDEDWKFTRFFPTPRMSSYLLAFTVTDLEAKLETSSRVPIRIYAKVKAIEAGHTDYAASMTAKIFDFFEKHLQIEYELNKLEQVALPDLMPLAMENWGLITYQEGVLLYEDGVSSLLHKEEIINVIAHELAHQWFGNLVTMKWWNEIWLNEGFATYMSYLGMDYAEPDFKIKDLYIMDDLHLAFQVDALLESHPLSAPLDEVQTPTEVYGMFDVISYSKGAMVLRMLADVVGQTDFDRGIRNYLQAFKGQNAEQSDLWNFIQNARHNKGYISVSNFMEKWTKQIGYPVLTINTTDGRIYQKHFLYNNLHKSNQSWLIPIKVMKSSSVPSLVWLDSKSEVTVQKEEFESKKGEWVLANVNCTGYYRVNYDPVNWQALLHQLETNPQRIPLMNRGQLIDDAFNLARAKQVNVTLALNSTRFLHKETEYIPWESAVRNLEYFTLMFDRSEVYGPMQLYLREKVKGLYEFFKNDTDNSLVPDDHSLQHNQILAINLACSNGLPECTLMVQEKFSEWMETNETNNIHTNLRSIIYCQAVAVGGKDEWEFAWEKFLSSSDTSEKEQLRRALACTKKTWLLSRYLQYTLDPDKIRLMDAASTIYFIAQNPAGHALAWNFIRAHWDYIGHGNVAELIEGVSSRFSTQFELDELRRFRDSYELNGAARVLSQAIEQTAINIQWVKENKGVVLQWFESETALLE